MIVCEDNWKVRHSIPHALSEDGGSAIHVAQDEINPFERRARDGDAVEKPLDVLGIEIDLLSS